MLKQPEININQPGAYPQWSAYYEALRNAKPDELKDSWQEITLEQYEYLLECVPPIRMRGSAFMVGECITHGNYGAIYEAVTKVGARYFSRPALLQSFNPETFAAEIRAQFKV